VTDPVSPPPSRPIPPSLKAVYQIVVLLLIVLAAYSAFLSFVRFKGVDDTTWMPASFKEMVEGTAWKPFVTRSLLPWTVKQLSRGLTPEIRQGIERWVYNTPEVAIIVYRHNYNRLYLPEIMIGWALIYLSILGFGFSLRSLFDAVFVAPFWARDLVTLAGLLCIPLMFKFNNYIYDMPVLFLFTLGLALMARRRWIAFTILYVLAVINKETTILLTWIFLIHFGLGRQLPWRQYLTLAAIQGTLWVAIRAAIDFRFRNSPGDHLKIRMSHNIWVVENLGAQHVLLLAILIAGIFLYWTRKPPFLRHSISIMIPLLGLTWFLGWINETRDYYEAYPAAVLLYAHTLATLLGRRWEIRTWPTADHAADAPASKEPAAPG
jgi:hypothetical protein